MEHKLSVIIPARNEIYLERTIRNVLDNAKGDIEVIAVLDGWLPDPQIDLKDNRVTFLHFKDSVGQRAAVNAGVKAAKGKFIMKLDAHCAVDEGFDVKLAADCEPDWTVVPRMYNLDVETWKPKLNKRTDYMYISPPDAEKPFRAMYYEGGLRARWNARPELIDDTMCCMGPGWFMHKDRFFYQEGCDVGHGGWGQQGVEVSLKAWLSGGALKVNKKTWFAHWFRGGGGPGFPYPASGREHEKARAYSRDLWLNDKWPKATRKFQWVIDKFDPPGWKPKKLSIIIPSYKDPLLHKTIQSILDNATGDIEIIPVIDGYEVSGLSADPRVKPVILKENVGMRRAINAGVKVAEGTHLMRSDEHCLFARGFDKTILENIEDNWIVVPRRYYLDPVKWEVMKDLGCVDYEKLIVRDNPRKFSGVRWPSRSRERKRISIDETMMMQGSCWVMSRKWWDSVIGELQTDGYGPLYQDTTEMIFKTWKSGGKLMLNKNTWYAHKHRSFNRTHQYPVSRAIPEWAYALQKWLPDYEEVKKKWKM